MTDTLMRQWVMLTRVPRAPRKVDTATLRQYLSDQGFEVDPRSIQRDLMKLSSLFPLLCDQEHRPYGWSWTRDAPPLHAPGMDVHTALAFRLAEDHLRHLLPDATRAYLSHWFTQARSVLDHLDGNGVAAWPRKVRAIPQGQPVQPPIVLPEVLEAVHHGLLHEQPLKVSYRKRGEVEPRDYVVHPLGLVYREAVPYLVCTLWDYPHVVQFVLPRMLTAEALDLPRRVPEGFSLDAYIDSRAFDFRLADEAIVLEALFHPLAAPRVLETPLAPDQVVTHEPDGRLRLRVGLADTVQLRTWLRGFAEHVEVVAPRGLRDELAASARAMALTYATAAGAP
jgi:predicted DNA-binding transcriptional regulator YafY